MLDPTIDVRHSIPGRTRLALAPWPASSLLVSMKMRLVALGCDLISARPETGTLLIHHPARCDADWLSKQVCMALDPSTSKPTRDLDDVAIEPVTTVLRRFRSRRTGLADRTARKRLLQHGPNILPAPQARGRGDILVAQFENLPVALLLGSAGLSLLTGGCSRPALRLQSSLRMR